MNLQFTEEGMSVLPRSRGSAARLDHSYDWGINPLSSYLGTDKLIDLPDPEFSIDDLASTYAPDRTAIYDANNSQPSTYLSEPVIHAASYAGKPLSLYNP